jgi:hypothetical protein
MSETALQINSPLSTSLSLSTYLFDFESQSERAARQNLEAAMSTAGLDQTTYTEPEIYAMVKLEQLKLIGDLSLAEVLLRGKIIKEIEEQALWSIHPNRYPNMQEAAKSQGISVSEYSNIRDLYNVVFPYLTDTLGMNLALVWEEVGKSNLRELTPYLVSAITGDPSLSINVGRVIDQMMDDLAASTPPGEVTIPDNEARQEVVRQLMDTGRLTNREVRRRIRNVATHDIPVYVLEIPQLQIPQKMIISLVDDHEYDLVQRRLRGITTSIPTSLVELMQTPLGEALNGASS